MLRIEPKQLSLYSILYSRIPENHILKLINNAVDFSFINKLLESSYCKFYGRPAKEPQMMGKLLILQYLYNLSDEQVIKDTMVNLAYMWFIGIDPEDELPNPSLLSKFRTLRLKEATLDDIIKEVVKQCVEKGIIKGTGISIDSTHTEANTVKKVPERIMKHLAKKIFKNLEEENGAVPDQVDKEIPNYKKIEDHNQAKQIMKNYLEKVMEDVEEIVDPSTMPKTIEAIEEAKEILSSPKFIEQKGIRSLVDKDARVGYKSKTDSFYGYKVEFAMIPEEKIITSVEVHDGAYVDGTDFRKHMENTIEAGINIKTGYGDKAYFRKSIIEELERINAEVIIPPSECVYRIDESKYSYNKDSDQWICEEGNYSISKKKVKRKDKHGYNYYFSKEDCINCPKRQECCGKAKKKIFVVGESASKYYEYSQKSKSEEFKEKYKKRACHENKNGEMKRFHGMARAKGFSLKSVRTQAKLTALAVNLKRIAKLFSLLFNELPLFLIKKLATINKYEFCS
ncbi:MAG: IS1182 family transposase [Nanoarchaeota archaeon]|nr:IS1182 family transposase [Nanoarchaeota archaeon]